MNLNRRHLIIILIVIMASVFFVSCGIPTYRTLSGISLKSTKTEEGYTLSFTGSDSDLEYIKDGPGLMLLYVETDSNANTFSSSVVNKFSTEYGNSSSIGKKAVVINNDDPIIDLDTTKAYSFRINGNKVSPWKYFFDISENSNSNSIFSSYLFSVENNQIKVSDSINSYYLTKANGDSFTSGNYVHIFASFSCQSTSNNNFSNIYWSNLLYVGYFYI